MPPGFKNHDGRFPQYAILSHRWSNEEVSFQEFTSQTEMIRRKDGFAKILNACNQAASDGYEYIWIDTCCIDKTNLVELTEAINSMYRWYENSNQCYAYLFDVFGQKAGQFDDRSFAASEWFWRGWTLQELIAPPRLTFYDKNWEKLGDKSMFSHQISEITGIPLEVIQGEQAVRALTVAQRMSWMALRSTERIEDLAYCLLGLFEISMPMIYGEGEKAFERLQLEIMNQSTDQTLFAWSHNNDFPCRGLLARHPIQFENCRNVTLFNDWKHQSVFERTNKGIRVTMPLIRYGYLRAYDPPMRCSAILPCYKKSSADLPLAIPLVRAHPSEQIYVRGGDVYTHAHEDSLLGSTIQEIYIAYAGEIKLPAVPKEENTFFFTLELIFSTIWIFNVAFRSFVGIQMRRAKQDLSSTYIILIFINLLLTINNMYGEAALFLRSNRVGFWLDSCWSLATRRLCIFLFNSTMFVISLSLPPITLYFFLASFYLFIGFRDIYGHARLFQRRWYLPMWWESPHWSSRYRYLSEERFVFGRSKTIWHGFLAIGFLAITCLTALVILVIVYYIAEDYYLTDHRVLPRCADICSP